jgi:hypothetical protein
VIERDTDVRDVRFGEQHQHRTHQAADSADFRAIVRLSGRRAVKRAEELVCAVDQMDLHEPRPHAPNRLHLPYTIDFIDPGLPDDATMDGARTKATRTTHFFSIESA